MENRFDRIDEKLDSLQKSLNAIQNDTTGRLVKLETTQKGVIALCLAVITAGLGSLAKLLHI